MSSANGDGRKNPLTWRIFGTLKYIERYPVYEEDLYKFRQGTIWACAHDGYITKGPRNGNGKRPIFLTSKGHAALHEYTEAKYAQRHGEGVRVPKDEGLTERVSQVIARVRVIQMRRSA